MFSRSMRARARALSCDRGFSLVEITVATGLAMVAVAGVGSAMVMGVTGVGVARQRAAATAIATERVERIQNLPYDLVALTELSSDAGWTARKPADETLVVQPGHAAVIPVDDPVVSGPSEFYIYQYITWLDDPDVAGTQDYKRATVIVSWRRSLSAPSLARVTLSTRVGTRDLAHATPAPAAVASPSPT
ncbi:MAG TPA: hypothetical protein VM840_06420, partial [Actinomycetota bacterium]|nr:hypothetical protein [Actinomycetota bacterium]